MNCDVCNKQLSTPYYKCINCTIDYRQCCSCEDKIFKSKRGIPTKLHKEHHDFNTHTMIKLHDYSTSSYDESIFTLQHPVFTVSHNRASTKLCHTHVTCSNCQCAMSNHIRYCCLNCEDYNLCEYCENKGVHDQSHYFMKLRSTLLDRRNAPLILKATTESVDSNKINIDDFSIPNGYTIKHITDEDIDFVHAIEQECFNEIAFKRKYFTKLVKRNVTFDSDVEITGRKFVAYCIISSDIDTIVGYMSCRLNVKSNRLVSDVDSIAVSRQYQCLGLGRTLLQYFVLGMKKLRSRPHIESGTMSLCVNVNNYAAQRLYSRVGFNSVDWIDSYYQNEDADALKMQLEL
jgi:ribosomal protein S18 acetylase RimI-like enzyme